MTTHRTSDLASRITLAFALMAVVVALSALLAWRAHAQAEQAHTLWVAAKDMQAAVERMRLQSQSALGPVRCGPTGPAAVPDWTNLVPPALQLGSELRDAPVTAAGESLQRVVAAWQAQQADAVQRACQAEGTSWVDVREATRAPQAAVDEGLANLKRSVDARFGQFDQVWRDGMQALRRWLGWLALTSVLTAAAALLAVRGFMQRLVDVRRKVFDEGREREHAKEELAVTQRRMRVLVDHVKDAVVAFDAEGRIQWINPAGEAMFAAERDALLGTSVTALMPQLSAELEAAALTERATVTDELGLPWFSKTVAIEGHRLQARGGSNQRIALDVSLVQTRVAGQSVGVAVARDLSHLRRLQDEKEAVLSALRRDVVPELRSLQAQLEHGQAQAQTQASLAAPSPQDELASPGPNHELLNQVTLRVQTLGRLVDEALNARR